MIIDRFKRFEVSWNLARSEGFTKHLRQIFEENDFPDTFHLHTLRHYFVSTMLHEGVDKQTVAELAGHGDTSFLERTCCHPQMALKEQAAEKMEQILLHSA
jgi:integrase